VVFSGTVAIRSELRASASAAEKPPIYQPFEIERLLGAQHGLYLVDELTHLLAQFQRPWRRHETAPGPDQQRIARCLAQPRQRPAHGRRAKPQALGGARHTPFREQHIQGNKQVEIGSRHPPTIARAL
jgi:hypothetical protein